MKQHITNNQLHDVILPNGEWDDKAIDKCYRVLKLPKDKILSPRLFTIGKMIEIVTKPTKEYAPCIYIENNPGTKTWEVMIADDDSITREKTELCDALWEEVKKVLEVED